MTAPAVRAEVAIIVYVCGIKMAKKLPKYKQEMLLWSVLRSKLWYLFKCDIIDKNEYILLHDKIRETYKETKVLEKFPNYFD